MKQKERNGLILAVIVLALLVPMALLAGVIIGDRVTAAMALSADSISSWVSAIATVAIAILTFILARETWYLRETQMDQIESLRKDSIRPIVSIALTNSPVDWNFFEVEVRNLGRGIARNVRFRLFDHLDQEIPPGSCPVADSLYRLRVFRGGISTLGVDSKFRSFLFSAVDLNDKLGDGRIFEKRIRVESTFEDMEGATYGNSVVLDFGEYEGLTKLGGADPLYRLANDIEELRKAICPAIDAVTKRVKVDVYEKGERELERQKRQETVAARLRGSLSGKKVEMKKEEEA